MRVPHMLFSGREDYKVRGTQATQRHKLVETQDVVLIRREIVFTSNLSYSEAKLLLETAQSFYLNNTRYKLVERFNKESSEFEFKRQRCFTGTRYAVLQFSILRIKITKRKQFRLVKENRNKFSSFSLCGVFTSNGLFEIYSRHMAVDFL